MHTLSSLANGSVLLECKYAEGKCVSLRKEDRMHRGIWTDTNNHQGWKPTEQFRAPLRISQQLWAFSEACESTFLLSGQILWISIELHKSLFYLIACQAVYCKTRHRPVIKRVKLIFHYDLMRTASLLKKHLRITVKLTGVKTEGEAERRQDSASKTGRIHSSVPSLSTHFLSHDWSSSPNSNSPTPIFLFLLNVLFGTQTLKVPCIPVFCFLYPGCHHRAVPAHFMPFLDQRARGSNP